MLSAELRLITLIEMLIIQDITKTESVNCFIVHCLKKITSNTLSHWPNMTLLSEIIICVRNLQIIHFYVMLDLLADN